MATDAQREYIQKLIRWAGFDDAQEAIRKVVFVGETSAKSTSSAFIHRAANDGRDNLDRLTIEDAGKLIGVLNSAIRNGRPDLGLDLNAARDRRRAETESWLETWQDEIL